MPLDDNEQRILEEIERQFYEEDPALAHEIRNIDRPSRFGVRLPAVGLVVGIAVVLAAFTSQTLVALAGFALMVVSATALVHGVRTRGGLRTGDVADSVTDRIRRLRRFRRS